MVVTCTNCEARLQLDDTKAPSRQFKIRCPKCQTAIDVHPQTDSAGASQSMPVPDEMTPPSNAASPFESPVVAAPYAVASRETNESEAKRASDLADIARLLASFQNAESPLNKVSKDRPAGYRRKALVCTSPAYREIVAQGLVAADYEVFIADNTAQALGRMREDRMDVLILDANFDPIEQGFAFVTREVKLLRPTDRRRLFLTYLTATARTMDLHSAFLHNVNLVVNPSDVDQIAEALNISIRHYNELYRDFHRILEVPVI